LQGRFRLWGRNPPGKWLTSNSQLPTSYRYRYVVSKLASMACGNCFERKYFEIHKLVYSFAKVGFVFLMPANIAFFTSSDWIIPMLYAAT
jgi:hypothetical protein